MLTQGPLHDFMLGTIHTEGHIHLYPGDSTASLQEGLGYLPAIVMQSILNAVPSPSPIPQPWAVEVFWGSSPNSVPRFRMATKRMMTLALWCLSLAVHTESYP